MSRAGIVYNTSFIIDPRMKEIIMPTLKEKWQIDKPIDAVIFDCDSTLSGVEGITILAEQNGVYPQVHLLTEKAMNETGLSLDVYKKRLELVRPRKEQMDSVVNAYWENLTPHVNEVIDCLQGLGKSVFVVSAGVQEAVAGYAKKLHIPEEHVFAVDIYFDHQGNYKDFDNTCALATQNGKLKFVNELRKKYSRIAHIGDGMNDVEAAKHVDRFIGYGGVKYRELIAEMCDFYITCKSLSPLLPLLLTTHEAEKLNGNSRQLYVNGLQFIAKNCVEIRG